MWCIGIRSWYLALRAQHSNHYTTLYVLMSSHPTPLKVHNCIRIPKWLRNNKHPLLFVWIASWKCPLKEEDALCFSKYRCAQSWVSKSINLEGSGNSRRKTGKTRENLGVASSFWRLWEGKKYCGKVSFGLCCIMRLFWRELHHSVWRSKDLLACNATYSIATKGQNAVFFLHLIYGLDYYARARHIFHSSISFSSSKCLCCYNCIMYIQNVFIPVTKFQHCWNSCIGKKYIFRHEFGVLFGISNSLISLHFTWKSGQKSCQTSDFPTLCIYQEEQVLSM